MLGLLVEQNHLVEILNRLHRPSPVSRTEAALLLVMMAATAIMLPALHPLRSQLSCSPESKHSIWFVLADKIRSHHRLQSPEHAFGYVPTNQLMLEISLEMVFVIYLSNVGREDEMWDVLGVAIRKGASISLFDERHALWKSLSLQEKVQRKKVALCIAATDAWAAFNRMRQPGIHWPSLRLDFSGIPSLVGEMDPRQLSILHRCHNYVFEFEEKDSASRYVEASILCDDIMMTTGDILKSMGVTIPIEVLASYISSAPEENQADLLVCVSTSSYAACLVTRRFLTDPKAPLDLRFVSLQHAQNILATVPIV